MMMIMMIMNMIMIMITNMIIISPLFALAGGPWPDDDPDYEENADDFQLK